MAARARARSRVVSTLRRAARYSALAARTGPPVLVNGVGKIIAENNIPTGFGIDSVFSFVVGVGTDVDVCAAALPVGKIQRWVQAGPRGAAARQSLFYLMAGGQHFGVPRQSQSNGALERIGSAASGTTVGRVVVRWQRANQAPQIMTSISQAHSRARHFLFHGGDAAIGAVARGGESSVGLDFRVHLGAQLVEHVDLTERNAENLFGGNSLVISRGNFSRE